MALERETLAKLLAEAAEAHHEYEQTLDERDSAWAQWYADYIVSRLDEEGALLEEPDSLEGLDEA